MIEAKNLTKRYGDKVAVNDLTFTVQPGIITGFLGPNGAGKSTTMRMILGLDAPSGGTVTVGGKPYRQHAKPLQLVGCPARGSGGSHLPVRLQPPVGARRHPWHRKEPGRGGHRDGRAA